MFSLTKMNIVVNTEAYKKVYIFFFQALKVANETRQ